MQHDGRAMLGKRIRQRFRIQEVAFGRWTQPNELAVTG